MEIAMEPHTEGQESSQEPKPEAKQQSTDSLTMSGLSGLIAATRRTMAEEKGDASATIRRLSEDFAHIQLRDVGNPIKFLRQMEGQPPIRLGTHGFRREIVDDANPARHYMAFVAMGYWLPYWLAICVLYLWEIAGFIRYGFTWSKADMLSGLLGVRHGNVVRRRGIDALPSLMVADLAAEGTEDLTGDALV
jgi:hypothetical protein